MREFRVESTESRMQSREYREYKGTESRGGSRVHDDSTVRQCRGRVQTRECRECENAETKVRCESTEARVHSTESARVQSREEGAECTMKAQCEVQRVRECRAESTESRVQRVTVLSTLHSHVLVTGQRE